MMRLEWIDDLPRDLRHTFPKQTAQLTYHLLSAKKLTSSKDIENLGIFCEGEPLNVKRSSHYLTKLRRTGWITGEWRGNKGYWRKLTKPLPIDKRVPDLKGKPVDTAQVRETLLASVRDLRDIQQEAFNIMDSLLRQLGATDDLKKRRARKPKR